MVGDNPVSRRPAQTEAGQRRRLTRRSGVPRSNTTPLFTTALAAASESSEGLGSEEGATGRHAEEGAIALETSQSMMNFYPPSGIPADLRPTAPGGLSGLGNESPTPSAGSEPSTKADGKKKHGRKIKDFVLGSNKQLPPPLQPTPLPPSTPTKAAKLLGVAPDAGVLAETRSFQHDGSAYGASDGPSLVKYGWPQQYSAPDLMRSASSTAVAGGFRDSKFREEDIDVDMTKPKDSKSFWNSSKRATKKMSGFFSPFITSPQKPSPAPETDTPRPHLAPPHSRFLYTDFVDSIGHGLDDSHYLEPPRAPPAPVMPDRPVPAANSRRPIQRRGRQPKGMDEMPPITEAVHDNTGGEGEEEEEDDEESEDDDDLPSLRSSIDLSEEPTVHVATAMTITRVTPGMVKLVNIPPRRE